MKRIFAFIISLCLVCFSANILKVKADNNSYYSVDVFQYNDYVHVRISSDKNKPTAAAFLLNLKYNSDELEFTNINLCKDLSSKDYRTCNNTSEIISVYACNVNLGYAQTLSDNFVDYCFRIIDTTLENSDITVSITQSCDYNGKSLDYDFTQNLCYDKNTTPVDKDDENDISDNQQKEHIPKLSDLQPVIPSNLKLEPDFSPDVYNYKAEVYSDCKDVYFNADSEYDDDTISINRHKLYSQGKTTQIIITVGQPRKQKTMYYIDVYRKTDSLENNSATKSSFEYSEKTQKSKISSKTHDNIDETEEQELENQSYTPSSVDKKESTINSVVRNGNDSYLYAIFCTSCVFIIVIVCIRIINKKTMK